MKARLERFYRLRADGRDLGFVSEEGAWALAALLEEELRTPEAERVLEAVSAEFGLGPAALRAPGRGDESRSWPRQVAMFLLFEGGWADRKIGRFFGKCHSTVMHARNAVRDRMEVDRKARERVERLQLVIWPRQPQLKVI